MNGNSAKFYDKAYSEWGSVLRGAETTINAVSDFRVYRAKEGGPEEDLQWLGMRKGIADLNRRAEVSQKTNDRLLNALASVDDSQSVEELTAGIQKHTHWNGRRMRALHPWAEDKELFIAVNHGEFLINGFRNRDLQKLLYHAEPQSPLSSVVVAPPPSAGNFACCGRMASFRKCRAPIAITSPTPDGSFS